MDRAEKDRLKASLAETVKRRQDEVIAEVQTGLKWKCCAQHHWEAATPYGDAVVIRAREHQWVCGFRGAEKQWPARSLTEGKTLIALMIIKQYRQQQ